ncbi:hypothetical protein LJR164_003090 [Phenylobacterium sp. LjRoot164]|jgi:hypothetical protein|uniref:hypothetical protein n=1 Tax=unclassified Phenylobacterium TaxID=2640670 RepID=UPI0025E270FE|nr:hypothetical protein [Phenylobacterium sp.]MBA4010373.1 hypothetical protein [Phenylobacterium sp.]
MSKAPPIPKEQRSFRGQRPDIQGEGRDRRDAKTGVHSAGHGDDFNTKSQGRQGNIHQNVDTVHARTQDR